MLSRNSWPQFTLTFSLVFFLVKWGLLSPYPLIHNPQHTPYDRSRSLRIKYTKPWLELFWVDAR